MKKNSITVCAKQRVMTCVSSNSNIELSWYGITARQHHAAVDTIYVTAIDAHAKLRPTRAHALVMFCAHTCLIYFQLAWNADITVTETRLIILSHKRPKYRTAYLPLRPNRIVVVQTRR